MLMEISMKENGRMIKPMVRVLTYTRMEPSMMEVGRMTSRMEKG